MLITVYINYSQTMIIRVWYLNHLCLIKEQGEDFIDITGSFGLYSIAITSLSEYMKFLYDDQRGQDYFLNILSEILFMDVL